MSDPILAIALASITAIVVDNKLPMIMFFVSIGGVVLVITIVKVALSHAIYSIYGTVIGCK